MKRKNVIIIIAIAIVLLVICSIRVLLIKEKIFNQDYYEMKKINESKKGEKVMSLMNVIFNVVILIVVTGYLIDGSFNPFLYFRF